MQCSVSPREEESTGLAGFLQEVVWSWPLRDRLRERLKECKLRTARVRQNSNSDKGSVQNNGKTH